MNVIALREKWESFSKPQKTILIIMSISVILATAFFVHWLTRVEYAELFSGLDAQNAGQIVEKLQDMGVQYKLAEQGSTILVPANQVYDLRIQLASAGIIASGGTGFELFDESRLGITDYERHVNYQRALEEELRRSIVQLDAVEQARVHLVLPEQSLFIRDEGQASASIVLKLSPTAQLQPSQVKAIINLVAGSVEKLEPQNVHVIDTLGNTLSDGLIEDERFNISQSKNYEQKRLFEKDLEQRIQNVLQKVLGPGKTVTMVSAELDFDMREVTRIEFGDSHVRSEQVISEEHINRSQGGVVGQDNLQDLGTTYPELENGESASSFEESITNYELDQLQETVVYAPGKLISLSTAVAVDGNLDENMIDSIRQMVAAAIGFNPERGDQIAVMGMEFDNRALQEEEARMAVLSAQEQKEEQMKTYISYGFRALAIIFALVVLVFVARALRDALKPEPTIEAPISLAQMQEEVAATEMPRPKDEATRNREKVRKVAEEKPEETAKLLKQWLLED